METRADYALIGAAVVSVILLGLVFALWLGSVEREYDEYEIVFTERVSGLSVGSGVLFAGINIGEVKDLNLAPNNPAQVIARIRVTKDTPVKTDTRAELELVGITGLVNIQLEGGGLDSPLLRQESRQKIPRIPATTSDIALFLGGAESIMSGVQNILSEENRKIVTMILHDVQKLTGALSDNKEQVTQIIQNTSTVTTNLASTTENLDETIKRISTMMTTLETFVNDGEGIMGDVRVTAAQAAALAQELNSLLDENRESIDSFAQQGLGQSSAMIADTRRLLETLERLLGEAERDPARFFFGETRPEYEGK